MLSKQLTINTCTLLYCTKVKYLLMYLRFSITHTHSFGTWHTYMTYMTFPFSVFKMFDWVHWMEGGRGDFDEFGREVGNFDELGREYKGGGGWWFLLSSFFTLPLSWYWSMSIKTRRLMILISPGCLGTHRYVLGTYRYCSWTLRYLLGTHRYCFGT